MPNIVNLRDCSLLLLVIILFSSGCSKTDDLPDVHIFKTGQFSDSHMRIREDPYAIHNILKAFHNLQSGDPSIPNVEIKPNHLYLRFLPQNESELELLQNDSTLVLYDYPLNGDVYEGEFSGDPFTTASPYACQYCVVKTGQTLPDVRYEVLYEVFIPPADDRTARSSDDMSQFYENLVNESARLTGNFSGDDTSSFKVARSSSTRWKPKGRIRAWDDLLNMYIPLTHVNVHARWFTHVETCLTDSDGYFSMSGFSHAVNYSIKWENSLFTIRDGVLFQAWYNGPKKKGDWMLDIKGGKSGMFATIHRAAYRQFYGDNLGMSRPTLKTGGRTKICYMDGNGTGEFLGDFSAGGIIPDIKIWGNRTSKLTNDVFATVSHELGHQLHSQYVGNIKFMRTSKRIRESWAEAVEWAMTNDEYHKLGMKYGVLSAIWYDYDYSNHLDWPYVPDPDYSPVFIDLVDNVNQRVEVGPGHPNDLISHYSISYINHNLLSNTTDIGSLQKEVGAHKLGDVDDYQINQLFLLY